jgi:hypothetical protein
VFSFIGLPLKGYKIQPVCVERSGEQAGGPVRFDGLGPPLFPLIVGFDYFSGGCSGGWGGGLIGRAAS